MQLSIGLEPVNVGGRLIIRSGFGPLSWTGAPCFRFGSMKSIGSIQVDPIDPN